MMGLIKKCIYLHKGMSAQFAGGHFVLSQHANVHVSALELFFLLFLPLPAYTELVNSIDASIPKIIFFIINNLDVIKLFIKDA